MTLNELEKDFEQLSEKIKKFFKDRDNDSFLKESEKFIVSNPDNKSIHVYRGIILEEKEQYEEAVKSFEIVTENCPDFYHIFKMKGYCYLQLKCYALARDAYKESLRYNDKDAEAWCYTALCFYFEDKKAVAIGLLDHAMGLVENKSLVSLLKGMLYEKEDMDEDALISYVESQIFSRDEEEKQVAGERAFKMFNKD